MPDKPCLPDDHDFTPLQVEIASQSIEATLGKGVIAEHFDKSLKNHEKFAWLWGLEKLHTVFDLEDEYIAKNSEKANEHRRDGNRYFTKKSFMSAGDCYTASIRCAPVDPPEDANVQHELPMAYANRSAALLHLRRFQLCIRDTELAIEHSYPKDSHYKLYDRRGKAFAEMGCKENAIENFKIAKELLDVSDLNEKMRNRWGEEIDKQLKKCDEIVEALIRPRMDSSKFHKKDFFNSLSIIEKGSLNKKKDPTKLPQLKDGPSEDFPHASKNLKSQYSDNKGRYFTTNEDIDVGDCVVIEKPIASIVLADYQANHCYACFEKLTAPIPCLSCASVVYCSKECRDESWKACHKYECKQFFLFGQHWMGKLGHLAHRIVLTFGVGNIIQYLREQQKNNEITDPTLAGRSEDGVYKSDLHSVMNLVTNIETRIPESVFDFGVFAAFLIKLLKLSNYLKDQSTDTENYESTENICILAGGLITILMMLQCNKKGVKELMYPTDFENPQPTDIGVALYPTVALANHSCYPNTFLAYYGNTAVMRASRNIWSGREVTLAHELSFYHIERRQRQMSLKATFSFHCDCVACQQLWGLWRDTESEYPCLVCEQCHREIDISDLQEKRYLTCKACKHTTDISECWNKLTSSHDEYGKCIENTVHGKSEGALSGLIKHMNLMQKHIMMPWKDMLACELAIINCYKLRGNKRL